MSISVDEMEIVHRENGSFPNSIISLQMSKCPEKEKLENSQKILVTNQITKTPCAFYPS